MKKILAAFLLFALTFSQVNAQTKHNAIIHIKLIETSDVHGCVFPQDLVNQRIRKGSLAQVETYVLKQRANKSQTVILLDNGDILQGTPFVYYYNYVDTTGEHQLAAVMNYMKYDVGTVGNHDIEPGHPVYDKFRKELNFPWLAANAINNKTGKPYFKPYTVLYRNGVKIAVLGMITPSIPNWLPPSIWSGMHFNGMVATAKKWVKIIQEKEHPDVLVGLFHSGTNKLYGFHKSGELIEDASRLVAKEVPGFDVVFAGHDHKVDNEIVTNMNGKEVLLLDPAAHAENVAVADITLIPTAKGFKKETTGHIVSMTKYKPNQAFMNKFNKDFVQVKNFVDRKIGSFTNSINSQNALFMPTAFMGLIHTVQLDYSHADISIVSLLSTRAKVNKGSVYVRDMFKLYRFENLLYTMKLSGKEVKNAMEYTAGLFYQTMKNKNSNILLFKTTPNGKLILSKYSHRPVLKSPYFTFITVAGIKYTVDVSKKPGNRITILSMADGKPFDLNKEYSVAINSYQGNGGGGTLTEGAGIPKNQLSKRIIKNSSKDIRYLMMKWIEKKNIVTPKSLHQWKLIPEKWTIPAIKKDKKLLFGN